MDAVVEIYFAVLPESDSASTLPSGPFKRSISVLSTKVAHRATRALLSSEFLKYALPPVTSKSGRQSPTSSSRTTSNVMLDTGQRCSAKGASQDDLLLACG